MGERTEPHVRDGSLRRPLVAAVASALLLAGCASGTSKESSSSGLHGTEVSDPYAAPATPLTNTEGAAYSLAEQTEKPLTLLFFGYTNCPDICQMVMANIASALARLDDAERARVDVVFVTTDPARDDAATLRDYLARFGDGLTGLTGDLDTIVDVGTSFGVYMQREKRLPTGGYDVSHTTNVFAIDEDDEARVTWRAETSPADLAADITTLLKADS